MVGVENRIAAALDAVGIDQNGVDRPGGFIDLRGEYYGQIVLRFKSLRQVGDLGLGSPDVADD